MKSTIGIVTAALIPSVLAARSAWAQAGERYYYGHHDMGPWGWFGGVLMMLLIIVLIVGAVVVTVRVSGHGTSGRSSSRAMDVLNERFARGEIERAEFEDRRRGAA